MLLVAPYAVPFCSVSAPSTLAEVGWKDHVLRLAAAPLSCRRLSQKGGEENYFHALLMLLPCSCKLEWAEVLWGLA